MRLGLGSGVSTPLGGALNCRAQCLTSWTCHFKTSTMSGLQEPMENMPCSKKT